MGAFSAAAPGSQPSRRILMEPICDRIFFAGEAAHETLFGTVGGAWESGERAPRAKTRARCASRRRARRPAAASTKRGATAACRRGAAEQLTELICRSPKALIAWSSGKDSAFALHEVRRSGDYEIVGALTTVTQEFERVSMHGVRE